MCRNAITTDEDQNGSNKDKNQNLLRFSGILFAFVAFFLNSSTIRFLLSASFIESVQSNTNTFWLSRIGNHFRVHLPSSAIYLFCRS